MTNKPEASLPCLGDGEKQGVSSSRGRADDLSSDALRATTSGSEPSGPDYADPLVREVAQAFADLNAGPWQTFAREAVAAIAIVRRAPSRKEAEARAEAALWREHDARAAYVAAAREQREHLSPLAPAELGPGKTKTPPHQKSEGEP